MNFDILLPIKPYYAYLIMKGDKTVEVRKFDIKDPNWSGKFKVYVSKDKTSLKSIPEADRAEFEKYVGKVAFEFVSESIAKYECSSEHFRCLADNSGACLTYDEIMNYCNGKDLYGYNITAPKRYEKPKELGEFRKVYKKDCEGFIKCDRNPCNYVDKETGKYIYHDCVKECPHLAEKYKVTHAPQSYMRIEEEL